MKMESCEGYFLKGHDWQPKNKEKERKTNKSQSICIITLMKRNGGENERIGILNGNTVKRRNATK